MFGLNALFAAIRRLTDSISATANLFDAANAHLAARLHIDDPDVPQLPAPDEDAEAGGNGRGRRVTAKKA